MTDRVDSAVPAPIHAIPPPEDMVEERRPYEPYGAARDLLYRRSPEVVLSGPAGTGKSRACLEKLHICAEKYPGMRGLIVRKTRESLSESALVTFEEKVLPAGHPALRGPERSHRQYYRYPNGSTLIVAGLKQSHRDMTQKVMSTEYDVIYTQEAIELSEHEWEQLTTRLRNGVMPYQQMIADTNPDAPTHWLRRRAEAGRCLMLESRHEDNPSLWDASRGRWTPRGAEYIARLDALTGVRYQRLRRGQWVQAEGTVYEEWDRYLHVIDPIRIPNDWPRWLSIDFGYTNPFVAQFWAADHDGRLYLYREYYRTKEIVEDHARRLLRIMEDDEWPQRIICDHDAEDRATLEKHLACNTTGAYKSIKIGIEAVQKRLRVQEDGKPRLFVFRNALVDRDPLLVEAKKPTCLIEEIDGYVWQSPMTASGLSRAKEEPLDRDNHALDAMRYAVAWIDVIQADTDSVPLTLGTPPNNFGSWR